MREVGFVKWFGGHNRRTGQANDYGFIERLGQPDIYFHNSGLLISEALIRQGTVVSFLPRQAERGTRQEAVDVKLLEDEGDHSVLDYCARSSDDRLIKKVAVRYLLELSSDDWHEAEGFVLRRLKNPAYARYLSIGILARSSFLRNGLAPHVLHEIIVATLDDASKGTLDRQIIRDLIDVIWTMPPHYQADLLKQIPSALYEDDPILRVKLPLAMHVQCIVRGVGLSDAAERDVLFSELRNRLTASTTASDWSQVPDALLRESQLWEAAPADRRLKFLIAKLEADRDDAQAIGQIIDLLQACPPEQSDSLVTSLPSAVRRDPRFLPLLSPDERVTVLAAQCPKDCVPSAALVEQICAALEQCQPGQRRTLIAAFSQVLRQQDCVIEYLEPTERISELVARFNAVSLDLGAATEQIETALGELPDSRRAGAVAIVPMALRTQDRLLPYLPPEERVRVLATRLEDHPDARNSDVVDDIISALEAIKRGYRLPAMACLPPWLQQDHRILLFLPEPDQLRVLAESIPNKPVPETAAFVTDVAFALSMISIDSRKEYLAPFPFWLHVLEPVYRLLPLTERFTLLIAQLDSESDPGRDPEPLDRATDLLRTLPSHELSKRLRVFQPWVLAAPAILGLGQNLAAKDQVDIWWSTLTTSLPMVWPFLSRAAKILILYRAVKERLTLTAAKFTADLANVHDDDPIASRVRAVFLSSSLGDTDKMDAFHDLDDALIAYIDSSYGDTTPIDLSPVLPGCALKKVSHCEGRHWKRDAAYCPRFSGPCMLYNSVVDELCVDTLDGRGRVPSGARIVADVRLPWQDWSLAEFLTACGITPDLPGLQSPGDYVPKMSGWVNRFNEIRARLSCSQCPSILVPNLKYAKRYAVYNTTVFDCPLGHESVYLNHCWCCNRVIDGRECQVMVEGFRLCLQCGSGPKESAVFSAGDRCPKCGESAMRQSYGVRSCGSCSHQIHMVARHRLGYSAEF